MSLALPKICRTGFFFLEKDSSKSISELSKKFKFNLTSLMSGQYSSSNTIRSYNCSDPYWLMYSENCDFYFCIFALPNWVEVAINEFNSKFKNIKLDTEIGFPMYLGEKYKSCFFKINFAENYPGWFKVYANLMVHHYFRMMSLLEYTYSDPFENWLYSEKTKVTKVIKKVLDYQNNSTIEQSSRHRMLSEINISEKNFLLLDNVDVIENSKIMLKNKFSYRPKQTEIFYYLKMARDRISYEFSEGDLITSNRSIPDFSPAYTYIVKGVMKNSVRIFINRVIITEGSPMEALSFNFRRITNDEKKALDDYLERRKTLFRVV